MKLNLRSTLIFRTPMFSYQSDLQACWGGLKKAISISSGDFYETIKDVEAKDLSALPPKVYFTIWKYFNRAKYRSTPYGTFASFSILNDAIKTHATNLVIGEEQIVHRFIDWPYRNQLIFDFDTFLNKNGFVFSNSSFYATLDGIRYIACTEGVFELAEIGNDDFVMQILNACLQPIRLQDLISKLKLDTGRESDLFSMLKDMHDLQLIFTDQDPNIIGEDYFKRIGEEVTEKLPQYIIAERKVMSGGVGRNLFKSVPNLLSLLQKIVPKEERSALITFIQRFSKKFEQREVSLLLALDPEMGVGYDELEQSEGDDFVLQFNNKKKDNKLSADLKSSLKKALSIEKFEPGKTVFLNELNLVLNEKPSPLPNSLSILLNVVDDLITMDQIGGVTANALAGRFSMANNAVEDYCKEISTIEQEANSGVLFFDVAYMVEATVDNINRRKLVYQHQLSILNYDTSANPLLLNDIQISVRNGQVVLRSKFLNKRLMPRIASAYNYTRSDLSVFRLLCDLQYQGIQSSLSLPLDVFFPDLNYYPRLQYQNIILNAQKWRVEKEALFPVKVPLSIDVCRQHLTKLGVSEYFKTGLSDQTLCFSLAIDEDLTAFMQFMQKQKHIYLEEVILPKQHYVVNEHAKPYLTQFILGITHSERIYNEAPGINIDAVRPVEQIFLPGSEWLYFEIFCHQQRADEILINVIHTFLQAHGDKIKSWFFIRYNENGNHLRFRINVKNEDHNQILSASFASFLSPYISNGLVSDFYSRAYKREIERYGSDLIEQVEVYFNIDSAFVLSILPDQPDSFSKYKFCATIADQLQEQGVFEIEELRKVIKLASDSYNNEHHLDAADFKKLNQQYQSYKSSIATAFDENQQLCFDRMIQSQVLLLQNLETGRKVRLFMDLMHMHVNRLFDKSQRTHEMVMYYLLLKDLQRGKATG
ncbi:thiopeptide-type bacteriocin biosynthesis protein [Pedobacter sp. N23S346]|uniref:lantibiotic dehydratase n=1 Tax=Pedobacter sp. N23S346 TaxID=3402750 RepID=UPI003ACDA43B